VETPPILIPPEAFPDISIVTPSFQQAPFLEATIRSVLLQGVPRLEYVVVDGGSTDGSVDIIRKYEPWISRWTSEADRGQSHAINKGLAMTTGSIVGWLNSDDRLLQGALQGLAGAATRTRDAVAWAASARTVAENGAMVHPRVDPRGLDRDSIADWLHAGHVPQPSCFFSRMALDRVGPLDERYHFVMDVDLWLRLASAGRIEAVDEMWAEETRHDAAKTTARRGAFLAELHLLQIRSGFEGLAMSRLEEELQELDLHRRRSVVARVKHEASLLLHPFVELLRRRRAARARGNPRP
jgi:glycosyltransferase involved in cell wall biosynthesis